MAEVYRHVNGQKLERFIATLPEVQRPLRGLSNFMAAEARAELAKHRHSGDARITVEGVDGIDWLITLNDERGQLASMSIEYGRRPSERNGGMEGLFILHRTFNLGGES